MGEIIEQFLKAALWRGHQHVLLCDINHSKFYKYLCPVLYGVASMKGFVLAAGFGTRLRPLTEHIPKALVPFGGRPLLEHALDFLYRNNISKIGVNVHHLPEQIYTYQNSSSVPFEIFEEIPDIRGTGGALYFAKQFLDGDDSFFVINADIIAQFDIQKILHDFNASIDDCRLIAWKNTTRTGTIVYNQDNYHYVGTPSATGGAIGFATADFIGMALYRREFLSQLKCDDFSIVPVWKRAVERGLMVTVDIVENGYWCDTGTPGVLAQAHFDVIDAKLHVKPPEYLVINTQRHCCYPVAWKKSMIDKIGAYCWIEEPAFVPATKLSRVIVYKNTVSIMPTRNNRLLLTPWGEILFND
jgi:mannose-1-phosphate guanylyltransferase